MPLDEQMGKTRLASAKQLRFWQRLRADQGIPASDQELDWFADLTVSEASTRISKLQESQPKSPAVEDPVKFEEPE